MGLVDRNQPRSGFGLGDVSPDSNFTLFSSPTSAIVLDRCSFASSEHHDHDFLQPPQHLAANHVHEVSSGLDSDLDPNKHPVHRNCPHLISRKVEKAKGQKEEEEEGENRIEIPDYSFSQALRECQERKSRSQVLKKKHHERRRPASLDLNNHIGNHGAFSPPRFGVAKKEFIMTPHHMTGTFPSPRTPPNCRLSNVGIEKDWSTERVSYSGSNANINRNGTATALMLPFNSARTMPSKWEDADRWIVSPLSNVKKPFQQQQQKQKRQHPISKSGPLGTSQSITSTAWSVNGHGWSELLPSQSSTIFVGDEKIDKDLGSSSNCICKRSVMARKMNPAKHSSSLDRRDSSSPPTPLTMTTTTTTILPPIVSSPKSDVVDVQVDEHVGSRFPEKEPVEVSSSSASCAWDVWESVKSISVMQREEAKITAWENLQKAKAEQAIQKLEMKLEKKKSSSMGKIMKKVRSAEKKAEEMRKKAVVILGNEEQQQQKVICNSRGRRGQINYLGGCFGGHAFFF